MVTLTFSPAVPVASSSDCARALLSVSMPEIRNVVAELEKAGLREQTRVIVGGAVVTEEFGKQARVDATAGDAILGVEICKAWSTS
jgi:methanogenic corrinoid protein MtbC1